MNHEYLNVIARLARADETDPANDLEANDDHYGPVELDVSGYVDHCGRKIDAIVGLNHDMTVEYVDCFDADGNKVEADWCTREAIVQKALE